MQKWGEKLFFKTTNVNESFQEISKDNGVIIVNYATSKHCQEYNVPTSQQL
jgi:hypothetical protein